MAKIRIVGDSSGYVEIAAPNAAGNNTLELPSGNTRLVGSDSAGNVSVSGIVTATTFSGNVTGNLNSTGVTTVTTLNATSIVGVTTAGITTAYIGAVNDGPLAGFRNFIINGNMAVSQRGTSFTSINTYTVDRWRTFGGPITFTVTQQDSLATYSPSRYAIRFARDSGATQTNDSGIAQGIETQNSYALRGKKVTISFRARCGANYSASSSNLLVRVFTGTGTDDNPVGMTGQTQEIGTNVTLTTSLQSFSVTGTLSSSFTQATLTFSYTPTGTAGANDWFEVTDVQLEIGDRATPFERRSFGQELALCQRYYWQINGSAGNQTAYNSNWYSTKCRIGLTPPTPMRIGPTITLTGSTAGAFFTTNDDSTYINFAYVGAYGENNSTGHTSVSLSLTPSAAGPGGGLLYIQSSRVLSVAAEL